MTGARLGFAAGALRRVWAGAASGVAGGRTEIGGLVVLFLVEDFVFITANARAVLGVAMFAETKLRPGPQWCNGNLPDNVRVK